MGAGPCSWPTRATRPSGRDPAGPIPPVVCRLPTRGWSSTSSSTTPPAHSCGRSSRDPQCTPPVIVGCRGCLADVRAATMSDPGPLTPEEEALVAELERELFGPLHGARQAEAAVHHDSPSLGHDSDPDPLPSPRRRGGLTLGGILGEPPAAAKACATACNCRSTWVDRVDILAGSAAISRGSRPRAENDDVLSDTQQPRGPT